MFGVSFKIKCGYQNVVYLCDGILVNNKKKQDIDACYNMDEPQRHAKWKKLDINGVSRTGNSTDTESRAGLAGTEVGAGINEKST